MFDRNDSPAFSYEETSTSGSDNRSPKTAERGHDERDVGILVNVTYFLIIAES